MPQTQTATRAAVRDAWPVERFESPSQCVGYRVRDPLGRKIGRLKRRFLNENGGAEYAEISEILGVPVGTAKGWVSRGRDTLLVTLAGERCSPRPPEARAWGSVEALEIPEARPVAAVRSTGK